MPVHANADERLLGHIFTNVLSNAVKYSEPGSTVHFRATREDGHTVFGSAARAIGLPEKDQQQLFKAFHAASRTSPRRSLS